MDEIHSEQDSQRFATPQSNHEFPENGPQFELVEKDGWGKRLKEWLNRYGSSVILPIVALIILASGIYLYATQKKQTNLLSEDENYASITTPDETDKTNETAAIKSDKQEQIIDNLIVEKSESDLSNEIKEIIPQKKTIDNIIILKAEQGEGITHLARKAAKEYLQNNPELNSPELTKEHKIFIEDYIKDKIGSKMLKINEEIEISENLINESINASKNLTQEQLKVIEKYSVLVVSL